MAWHRNRGSVYRVVADRRIARMGVVVIYRENRKNATPLQTRRITKALEGKRCPVKSEIIRMLRERKEQ